MLSFQFLASLLTSPSLVFCSVSPLLSFSSLVCWSSTPHPPLPFVSSSRRCSVLYVLRPFLPSFGASPASMDEESPNESNCVSARSATGTLQYLIESAFVWRELGICVWVSDKGKWLTNGCVDTVFVCRRETEKGKKKDISLFICMCGDSLGMKGFLQTYGNWFTVSLSPCLGRLVLSLLLSTSPPLIHFPSPCNPFVSLCTIMSPCCIGPYICIAMWGSFIQTLYRMGFVWFCCVCTVHVSVAGFSGPWGQQSSTFHHHPDTARERPKSSSLLSPLQHSSKHRAFNSFPSSMFRRLLLVQIQSSLCVLLVFFPKLTWNHRSYRIVSYTP